MLNDSRTLFLSIFFLFAQTSVAAENREINYKLECAVFHFEVVNNILGKATKIAEKNSEVLTVGQTQHLWLQLPEPFSDITLAFNHLIAYYLENEKPEPLPYIQAFFVKGKDLVTAPLSASFSLEKISTPGKLMLRDHFNYNDESMLTYQCSLHLF